MRKKKILFVSEASWKVTGYSVYTKEVLSRLSQIQNLEVAELACYACSTDTEVQTTPWKVYPNKPHPSSPEFQEYKGTPTRVFGEQTFNQILLWIFGIGGCLNINNVHHFGTCFTGLLCPPLTRLHSTRSG